MVVPVAPTWTACTERLPKVGVAVLLVVKPQDKRRKRFIVTAEYWVQGSRHMDETGWYEIGDDFSMPLEEATHWMPLPEMPE